MSTFSQALHHLKGNLQQALPEALPARICRDLGRSFRRRTLTPTVTTFLFAQQVLHGNTACSHLRHLAKVEFTDSAYCQARSRLPVAFFHRLLRAVTGRCYADDDDDPRTRWKGHRVFLMDGSSFSMPDTPELQEFFGQPDAQAKGCGFPVAHLMTLFDARNGFLLRAIPAPYRTHDMAQAALTHAALGAGDVLVGDRAFCSYAHLALCRQRQLHGLFRAHQRLIVDFRSRRPYAAPGARGAKGLPRSRWLKRLGRHDQLVEYIKPPQRPTWMSPERYASLPQRLVVRELRIQVQELGCRTRQVTLVTTLLDPKRYSQRALAKLYGRRWQVETNLRHLKQTLKMDVLRCTTVPGVIKELLMFVVVYNLVRRVMLLASRRQQVGPNRISFVDALRWLRHARPGEALPRLKVNPERPGRHEPRARKRRPKPYKLLTKPRGKLRETLGQEAATP
jgi:Transposase DDE domain